jgi:hypothetical protein
MEHFNVALLIPFAPFAMVVAIVGLKTLGKVAHHYLDWRLEMTRRLGGAEDAQLVTTIQALRAEVAALKQHEAETILTFDSTLQRLDDRLKHLETRALGGANTARASLGAESRPATEEPRSVTVPR